MGKLLLLLLSGAKLGKLFTTGGTMLLSVLLYAWVFGWRYAVGFVALLFVHEMGHYIAAKQRGLGGPLLGTVGAIVCYYLAKAYDTPWLLAVAYSGFFLNLFNMIPLSPFDGGRITAVLSPRIWLVGVPVLAALFWWRPSPMLILVAMMTFDVHEQLQAQRALHSG